MDEAVEETAEEFTENADETVEEASDVTEEAVEETAETVEDVAEEADAQELTGGVVLPGFFARMKAKVIRSVNLDEWKEDAKEASDEIENAADEVFGSEETEDIQSYEESESFDEPVESIADNPVEELVQDPAKEQVEVVQEKAPSKFAGFLNKVRSILPNQTEEPKTFEEEPDAISDTETADDVPEAATEPVEMTEEEAQQLEAAGDEFLDTVTGDLAEVEEANDDIADEPKVGFFGKIRNKFRNFDITEKIGLSMNAEEQEEAKEDAVENTEDVEEELLEKAEDFHDGLVEKIEDIKDSFSEKVEDFKETVEEKAGDIKEDIEITEAKAKAGIELQTEKIAQDFKEATEEISDDLKKKI